MTVIVVCPEIIPEVAAIIASPAVTAVSSPVLLTVAIKLFNVQVT